ncbi:MAG: HEPN domain-containing protein [Candidatus Edwardsbacteria bacterium]
MDNKEESYYRFNLARKYLEEAERDFENKEIVDTVRKVQLAVENGMKAVISCFSLPSWSHDPSDELEKVLEENKKEIEKLKGNFLSRLRRGEELARELAPEHGRITYGEPLKRITPWELYDTSYAQEILQKSKEVIKSAEEFIREWFRE